MRDDDDDDPSSPRESSYLLIRYFTGYTTFTTFAAITVLRCANVASVVCSFGLVRLTSSACSASLENRVIRPTFIHVTRLGGLLGKAGRPMTDADVRRDSYHTIAAAPFISDSLVCSVLPSFRQAVRQSVSQSVSPSATHNQSLEAF